MLSQALKKALVGSIIFGTALFTSCKDSDKQESIQQAKLKAVIESLDYQRPLNSVSQGSENPLPSANTVLVIVRTQASNIPPAALKKCLEAFLARSANSSFKVVTIEDLTGSASESLAGQSAESGMQNFASNQQVLQFALSQGIPAIITLNIDNINVREAKSSPGLILADARGTVSLLSGVDAARIETASGSTTQRGFDANQIIDNSLDALASSLASQITNWQLPELTSAKQVICEIHARIEGLTMPSFDMIDGKMIFQNQNIPLFSEGASVELDGVLVGQTPCTITTGRGMRKIKVYRNGLKPFEAVVNLSGKNRFDAILSPTPETIEQFNDQLAFLRNLEQKQALTEATVNSINGYAKMLRQSGFRIDQRTIKDGQKLSLDKEDRSQ